MRGYSAVGLFNPKTSANIGSALRACGVYGAKFLAIKGKRYKAHGTDTMKQFNLKVVSENKEIYMDLIISPMPLSSVKIGSFLVNRYRFMKMP